MSTQIQQDVARNNEQYAVSFTSGHLALPPARKYLVVTCMDARIDPAAAFGIALGDAHVIRNAGGNAKDALRSILTSQHLLGTREIVLVKHTGCGMLTFSNDDGIAALRGNGGKVDDGFDFQPFTNLQDALKQDVEFLKGHEGLAKDVPVSGWIYDVTTGRVSRIV